MRLSSEQAKARFRSVEEKAALFWADPEAGFAAGYHPLREGPGPYLLSSAGDTGAPPPISFAEWLAAVATKDLAGVRWSVTRFIGQGPGSAELAIDG